MTKHTSPNLPAVPQFPVATANYDQGQINQLNNSLRLYLNQINNTLGSTIDNLQSNSVLIWLNL